MKDSVHTFVEYVHSWNVSHDVIARESSTSNREHMMLDIRKQAALLLHATDEEAFLKQLEAVEGQLFMAHATGVIGNDDIDKALEMIGNIRKG